MSGQDNIHSASFVDHADSSSGRDGILGGKDRDLPRIKRRHNHPGLWEVTQEPGRIREEESQTSTTGAQRGARKSSRRTLREGRKKRRLEGVTRRIRLKLVKMKRKW